MSATSVVVRVEMHGRAYLCAACRGCCGRKFVDKFFVSITS